MLSSTLLAEFRKLGREIRKKQDAFVNLYHKALIEVGGKRWRDKDISTFFTTIQAELKPVLVGDGALSGSVFNAYCHAAKLALLFDVPFSIARTCAASLLPDVKQEFDQDDSDDEPGIKFTRALSVVRQRERDKTLATPQNRRLPFPEDGENDNDFCFRLCHLLLQHAEDERVSRHLEKNPLVQEILRHAKGVVVVNGGEKVA